MYEDQGAYGTKEPNLAKLKALKTESRRKRMTVGRQSKDFTVPMKGKL